jgi:hypothetical protein
MGKEEKIHDERNAKTNNTSNTGGLNKTLNVITCIVNRFNNVS